MDYRPLGHSGTKVSSLCLGTMTFGEADENSFMHNACCDDRTAFDILNRALDAGINFIDTADVYGQDGLSERVIGAWFFESGKRNDVVLATKFRFRMEEGVNGSGASRRRIMRAVEASLRRLRTDHIDLYQIHMQDLDTPEEEILRALDDLVRQGKVLYIGASNYAAYRLTDSLWHSRTQHLERFVTLQTQYNLAVRDIERELVPTCKQFNLGILPWSPLAGGFLTGKYRRDTMPTDSRYEASAMWQDRFARLANERGWSIVDALVDIAKAHTTTPAAVALAWLLTRPQVTSVIFGARSKEQLEANLAAAELVLSSHDLQRLEEASSFDVGYPYNFMGHIQGRW